MSAHTMTLTFDGSWRPSYRLVCHEPPEALCRADWDCDCEYYYGTGVDERGPWHQLADGYMTDEDRKSADAPRHYGEPGGECTYTLYVNESDCADEQGRGEVTFPVDLTWDGDEYGWAVQP